MHHDEAASTDDGSSVADVDHVFLTRFNLPSGGIEGRIRAEEGWLHNRVGLFERYCLPSVKSQTVHNFHWIVYFDPESPGWLLRWIENVNEAGTFRPIFRATVDPEDLHSDLLLVVGEPRRGSLLTTNIDNDDGIARDFAERLQDGTYPPERRALYLAQGLIKSGSRLYLRTDRSNAFCSVRETWESPATCWADWHNLLGNQMPTTVLYGKPAWLQVVHGANVSNRIRGRLVDPKKYRARFSGLLDDMPAVTPRHVTLDLMVLAPARSTVEALRSAVKVVIMRVGGKSTLDRVKQARDSIKRRMRR